MSGPSIEEFIDRLPPEQYARYLSRHGVDPTPPEVEPADPGDASNVEAITATEATAWTNGVRSIERGDVPPNPADHGYDQDGYCTGCAGDVPWLACPVWAAQPTRGHPMIDR